MPLEHVFKIIRPKFIRWQKCVFMVPESDDLSSVLDVIDISMKDKTRMLCLSKELSSVSEHTSPSFGARWITV
uniref:Uncharacterized protein n=1 Tax=Zea mays TaxID=4577 RepID=A0A804QLW2_MAIZE